MWGIGLFRGGEEWRERFVVTWVRSIHNAECRAEFYMPIVACTWVPDRTTNLLSSGGLNVCAGQGLMMMRC